MAEQGALEYRRSRVSLRLSELHAELQQVCKSAQVQGLEEFGEAAWDALTKAESASCRAGLLFVQKSFDRVAAKLNKAEARILIVERALESLKCHARKSPCLPISQVARQELLQDDERLREICDDYCAAAVGVDAYGAVGVRAAGRVVADIHRELGLEIPDDATLHQTMMNCASVNGCGLGREDFRQLIETVLRQCITGTQLHLEMETSSEPPTMVPSAGMINICVETLGGVTAEIEVDDAQGVDMLKAAVEAELGIPSCLLQFALGTAVLDSISPLHAQGVTSGSTLTVVIFERPPQATLLRIRRLAPRVRKRTPDTATKRDPWALKDFPASKCRPC